MKEPEADLRMSVDGLKLALERAAGVIQGLHVGHGHKGITGEAVVALATALQVEGESWLSACARATVKLAADFPNAQCQ